MQLCGEMIMRGRKNTHFPIWEVHYSGRQSAANGFNPTGNMVPMHLLVSDDIYANAQFRITQAILHVSVSLCR